MIRTLHWLGEALKETRCSLHTYALMTHPIHLLFTPKKAATVPKLVICGIAANTSSLIQAKTYLLTGKRYIELNPVCAWPWGRPTVHHA
ncbi:MAG: hypothetical protein MN733_09860 [Nitrososphaera sp.]|nr:hypothetical protein [Nitrososphaera sp.]